MRTVILFLFAIISLSSCLAQPTSPSSELDLLTKAYETKSTELLQQFFTSWHEALPTVSNTEWRTFDDTVQTLYCVFYHLLEHHRSWIGSSVNIVQNSVDFTIVDSVDPRSFTTQTHARTLSDFRPRLPDPGSAVVYLDKKYYDILTHFLDNAGNDPLSTGFDPSEPRSKAEFLRPSVRLLEGHWGGYWLLVTTPMVSLVQLTKGLSEALVTFSEGDYTFWGAVMAKKDSAWTVDRVFVRAIQ